MAKARAESKDLVELSENSDPPVVKIVDFKKFLFDEKKKEKKTDKQKSTLKELRLSPVIAENDLRIRVERAKQFLKDGNQVKFTLQFRGREITHPEIGRNKLQEVATLLEGHGRLVAEPKFVGPNLFATFTPAK